MKTLTLLIALAGFTAIGCCSTSEAQCLDGKCNAIAISITGQIDLPDSQGYQWQSIPKTDQLALLKNGKQVGAWDTRTHHYRPFDAATGVWGAACAPPIQPPLWANHPGIQVDIVKGVNCGVEQDKLKGQPRYILNGKEVTRADAVAAIEAGLVDDSGKLRLTVIGQPKDTAKVAADLEASPELVALRDKVLVRIYAPDDFDIADVGFVTTGTPTIYLQLPSGKVLHRQDRYNGPANLAEAIRKADSSYDPAKDRDITTIRPLFPDFSNGFAGIPMWLWLLAGGGLCFWLWKKNQK